MPEGEAWLYVYRAEQTEGHTLKPRADLQTLTADVRTWYLGSDRVGREGMELHICLL